MNLNDWYQPVAGILMLLIGTSCALGAKALWNGKPDDWPDVIADAPLLRKVAIGLTVVSVAMLTTGMAATLRQPWATTPAMIATTLFVIGGFIGNKKVFGDYRPMHTGTNTILAALIIWLLTSG